LIMLVALVSPPVFFAVERANVDLLMFALSMLAVVLMDRTFPFRLAGYAVVEAGAFLKYYPLALIALATRERSRRAIVIVLTSVVAFAAYVWVDLGVFEKVIRLAPVLTSKTEFGLGAGSGDGRYYSDLGFGADLLAQVVVKLVDRTVGARLPPLAIKLPLIVAACLVAFVIARLPAMSNSLRSLSARELLCLIAGSLVICFCFFAGSNYGYRAIFTLFVLPGLVASTEISTERWTGFAWAVATDAVLFLTWAMPADLSGIHAALGVSAAYLIVREALWWTIATVLLAAAMCFVGNAPGLSRLTSRVCS
jgi:hypothetical protein